jgi:P-type E1-E2 ATPase
VVTLPARDLVRGDVIRVAEGDRMAADALLREGTALSVDESLLTGESVPVSKIADAGEMVLAAPGGDGTARQPKLDALRASGANTDAEYHRKRKEIIDGI